MDLSEELLIIKAVLNGDVNAFEQLVIANQKKVYNLALKMTGNANDALDISQEAFLKAYSALVSFRADSRFSAWLYRLTHNLCVDFLRRKQRQTTVSLTYEDDTGEYAEIEIPDTRYAPERESERREIIDAVSKGLDSLSEEQREILIMREITGMSYAEISYALDINEGTVKSRLARARRRLAEILIQNGTFPDTNRQEGRREVRPDE